MIKRIFLFLAGCTLPLLADDIVVKEIGGVPVIRTRIRYADNEIEANIVFDMGSNVPMVIHKRSLGGLDLNPQIAEGREVDIELAGSGIWKGVPLHVEPAMPLIENLTRNYSQDLGEVPVVAIVGLPAIKSNVVELDLRQGLLRTLGLATEEAEKLQVGYEAKPFGMVLQGIGPTLAPAKILMTMASEDSILDFPLLAAARAAGKAPNVLKVGDTSFTDQTAFRFQSLGGVAPEPVDAVIGVGALRNFTVTMWPKLGKIAFIPQPPVDFPQAEQDYYLALADRKPDGVMAFIDKCPPGRLLDDACLSLWQLRLEDPNSTVEVLQAALEIVAAKYNIIRRCGILASIADQLEAATNFPNKEKMVVFTLNLAMKQSGNALDQTAAQSVHLRLGKRAFAKGDLNEARRHLLSAAFGLPKDGECNFWLGEVYRKMGKPSRAWSRYFQAILDPGMYEPQSEELLTKILGRLDDMNRDPEFRKTFNMVLAEEYMAGRLEDAEFHAPSRYSMAKGQFPGHVKLVEYFTNATDVESGGMQLAFQALDEYFQGQVAMIEYHLDDPMHSDAARQRLEFYKAKHPPLAVFDGTKVLNANGSRADKLGENAAGNFPAFRDASQSGVTVPESGWSLDVRMAQDGMKVSGSIVTTGKEATGNLRLHAILCERSVMAIEDSMVFFHHFVARKGLTPPDGLEIETALERPFDFSVDAGKMREDLARMLDSGAGSKGRSKPTYVDANKLMVVVFVQEQDTRRILAAETFSLPQEEGL